jgi:hypothetical protein
LEPLLKVFRKIGGIPFVDGTKWNTSDWTLDKVIKNYPNIYDDFLDFNVKGYTVRKNKSILSIFIVEFKFF